MASVHQVTQDPPPLSGQALVESLAWASNAALLDQAAQADNPLARELASRYEAALILLHREELRFSPQTDHLNGSQSIATAGRACE